MRLRLLAAGACLVLAACSAGASGNARDTLTQRQKDSLVGTIKIPGVAGVRGALKASDSAAARRRVEDSIGKAP